MKYQVTAGNIRPLEGGNVRAFVDVTLAGKLEIRGCKVVQQPGQRPWVAMPDQPWTGRDGEMKWSPLVRVLDDDLKTAITESVLSAWEVTP